MKVNTSLLIGASLMLVAAVLPMTNVSAHTCHSPVYTPFCQGDNCPAGTHDHTTDTPALHCTSSSDPYPFCPHFSPHSHTYGFGGSAGARSDTATGGDEVGAGVVTVFETNAEDCDGNGEPGDYDGDWETGVGGGFFGYGSWATSPICNYGLRLHGGTVTVTDVVFGTNIWFVIGADDMSGPEVDEDPVDGSTSCSTDGSITPGDPATDPTADLDDCLTDPQNLGHPLGPVGTGTTCGAGGDGGYWVFLSGGLVTANTAPPGVDANNPPTIGTITA